jgi:replicative DNA helicase
MQTPHDPAILADTESELGLLGALTLSADDAAAFLERHSRPARLFADVRHRTLLKIITALVDSGGETGPVEIRQRGKELGLLEDAGGRPYVQVDLADAATPGALQMFEARCVSVANRRELIEAAQKLEHAAFTDADHAGAFAKLVALGNGDAESASDGPISSFKGAYLEDLQAILAGSGSALKIGFPQIDSALRGGLRPKQLVIVAASTSGGKSAFAQHIATTMGLRGDPVGIFSFEMTGGEILARIASNLSGVRQPEDAHDLSAAEQAKLCEGTARAAKLPIIVNDNCSAFVEDLPRIAARWKRQHGIKILILDYIGLLRTKSPAKSIYESVSFISGALKNLARELDLPVLALCQVSRASGDAARLELRHLRDSGAIEQDAHAVLLLNNDGVPCRGVQTVTVNLAKNRGGRRTELKLYFSPSTMRWSSLDPSAVA